jgi:hypothetical protein
MKALTVSASMKFPLTIQLGEPEVIPIEVHIWRIVRPAAQIAEVLHVDERTVKLACSKIPIVCDRTQHRGSCLSSANETGHQSITLSLRQ